MKNKLALIVLTLTVLCTAGCASTWWQQFQSNPVAQVQLFETGVQTALSTAEVVWASVEPLLPAATQATAGPLFKDAVVTVNDAIATLNDAITVAVQAQNPNPDFSAAETAITDAIQKVLAIIDQYKGQTTPKGYASLQARVVAMRGPHVKK